MAATARAKRPTVPKGLGTKARRVWRQMVEQFEFAPHELRVLEEACREVDLIEELHRRLEHADYFLTGSQGQQVLNPLLREIREHRLTLQRLFASLNLPVEGEGSEQAARSTSARTLANARWRGGA